MGQQTLARQDVRSASKGAIDPVSEPLVDDSNASSKGAKALTETSKSLGRHRAVMVCSAPLKDLTGLKPLKGMIGTDQILTKACT